MRMLLSRCSFLTALKQCCQILINTVETRSVRLKVPVPLAKYINQLGAILYLTAPTDVIFLYLLLFCGLLIINFCRVCNLANNHTWFRSYMEAVEHAILKIFVACRLLSIS